MDFRLSVHHATAILLRTSPMTLHMYIYLSIHRPVPFFLYETAAPRLCHGAPVMQLHVAFSPPPPFNKPVPLPCRCLYGLLGNLNRSIEVDASFANRPQLTGCLLIKSRTVCTTPAIPAGGKTRVDNANKVEHREDRVVAQQSPVTNTKLQPLPSKGCTD